MTTRGTRCGKQHPDKPAVHCDRAHGHGGAHWHGPGHALRWGGKSSGGTYEKVTPLPAGKPLGTYGTPPAPSAAKFTDIPGQYGFDFDSDDPAALLPPEAGE